MEVSISFDKDTVKLGSPVTVNYSATDCDDVFLNVDNYAGPIDLGRGPLVSGTIKLLPLTDGQFNVQIVGSGRYGAANDYRPEITQTASCQVT